MPENSPIHPQAAALAEEKPPRHEYTVALRFTGAQLEPSDISARLDLQPGNCLDRSQIRSMKRQRRPYWAYSGADAPGYQSQWDDFAHGLQFLLKALDSRKAGIIAISRQFDAVWWCGHFQSSFDGGPGVVSRLNCRLMVPLAGCSARRADES